MGCWAASLGDGDAIVDLQRSARQVSINRNSLSGETLCVTIVIPIISKDAMEITRLTRGGGFVSGQSPDTELVSASPKGDAETSSEGGVGEKTVFLCDGQCPQPRCGYCPSDSPHW